MENESGGKLGGKLERHVELVALLQGWVGGVGAQREASRFQPAEVVVEGVVVAAFALQAAAGNALFRRALGGGVAKVVGTLVTVDQVDLAFFAGEALFTLADERAHFYRIRLICRILNFTYKDNAFSLLNIT